MRWPNLFQQKILGWKENCSEIGESEPSALTVFLFNTYYGMTVIELRRICKLNIDYSEMSRLWFILSNVINIANSYLDNVGENDP